MQTIVAADKSQCKGMAGTSPSAIWVMLHKTCPLQGRAEATGSSLKPQQKLFPRSAGALGAGPCCTQVSVTNRMAAPSITNK